MGNVCWGLAQCSPTAHPEIESDVINSGWCSVDARNVSHAPAHLSEKEGKEKRMS